MNDLTTSDPSLLGILDSFHRARVLVLGDVMLDCGVYGSVGRISPEAPIPVLNVERTVDSAGGAANVARNVASLGASALLIGVVGRDAAAERLRARLAGEPSLGVALVEDAGRPTTLKTRYVAERQQILRTDVETRAALSSAIAAEVLERFRAGLAESDVVILSDYAKGVLSDAVTAEAIALARAAGKQILVDPKSRSFLKYRGATLLTPNRHELEGAAGHECASDADVVRAASAILQESVCEALVVTRGADGMSIIGPTSAPTHIRTVAREVFELSGAGDTVVAALSLALANGAPLVDAARLANIAAGIVVGKLGTASVTAGEIAAMLDETADARASGKHFSPERVRRLVMHWHEQGLKVAFTNGCFDLLHPGHVFLLKQARETADRLVVGLNSDASVRRLKGDGRPVRGEVARAQVLASLKSVDAVVIFAEDTPLDLIEALEPDVLVKGADYSLETIVGADSVLRRGGKVVIADLLPAESTTSTIHRIAAAGKA
jgi:D-beta-D-heptose 7-phosphate kinase/D-beta-D-heptose 1-phosphate adenosyltransferase